jgi:hypothetical protein
MMRSAYVLVAVLCLTAVAACQTAAPATSGPSTPATPAANASSGASQGPGETSAPSTDGSGPDSTPDPGTSTPGSGGSPAPGELVADIAFDYGPGTFDFPGPATGLADLGGYHSSLTISFVGTDAGQPQDWTRTYSMVVAAAGAQRELKVAATGVDAEADALHRLEIDGVAYEVAADGTCVAGAVYKPDSLGQRWEPAGFLSGVRAATEAGSETVNNIDAGHYTFDERAFGPLPPSDSTGEMWVAADGGYLVRYLVSTVGDAGYFGEGTDGTVTWDYELTDVNSPAAILLPAACTAGSLDAPTPPDATDVVRNASSLSFSTASSLADVTTYYEAELSALGWQPISDPAVFDGGTSQDFTRDDSRLSLVITETDSGTTVRFAVAAADPPTE